MNDSSPSSGILAQRVGKGLSTKVAKRRPNDQAQRWLLRAASPHARYVRADVLRRNGHQQLSEIDAPTTSNTLQRDVGKGEAGEQVRDRLADPEEMAFLVSERLVAGNTNSSRRPFDRDFSKLPAGPPTGSTGQYSL